MYKKVFILLIFVLSISLYGVSQRYGDILVSTQEGFSGNIRYSKGYNEYIYSVSNSSLDKSYKVKLTAPIENTRRRKMRFDSISKTVTIAPNSKKSISLLVPAKINFSGSGLQIKINGVTQKEILDVSYNKGSYYNSYRPTLLYPNSLSINIEDLFQSLNGEKSNSYIHNYLKTELSIENWSANWLSYTSYSGIFIDVSDYKKMPIKVKSAIHSYVELGGVLTVLGECKPPEIWLKYKKENNRDFTKYSIGFGNLFIIPEKTYKDWNEQLDLFMKNKNKNSSNKLNLKSLKLLNEILKKSGWQEKYSKYQANNYLPMINNDSLPLRTLFFLMLGFVILVGPVNIIYLTKKKKKVLLLITVPLFSLIFTTIIISYSFISEGFSGIEKTRIITILDEVNHHANTVGLLGYYTPIIPFDGLNFDYESELSICKSGYREYGRYSIDLTENQSFTKGWISSRIPTHFQIRKSQMRKEKLPFKILENGSVSVTNSFDCKIEKLIMRLPNSQNEYYFTNYIIDVGKTVILNKNKRSDYITPRFAGILDKSKLNVLGSYFTAENLIKGSYMIKLDGSPFTERAMSNVGESEHETIVYGLMGGVNNED